MHKDLLKLTGILTFASLASAPITVSAQDTNGWSAGTAVVSSNASYRSYSSDVLVVPMIGYEGERIYLRGLTLGYYVHRQREQQLSVELQAEPFRYKPADSSDVQMQQLDRRKFSGSLRFRYNQVTPFGLVTTSAGTDITGRHNGQNANITYSYPFNQEWGGEWQFSPRIGVDFRSEDWVNYYYGISADESQRSGLAQYKGSHSFSPFIGVGGYTRLSPQLMLSGSITLSRLDSEITDSPMVSGRTSRTYFVTLSYRF